jgi:hypothetical protein
MVIGDVDNDEFEDDVGIMLSVYNSIDNSEIGNLSK